MKVALVYDRVNKWGGAERVLLALHEIFPEAPLYTSVYNSLHAPWAKEFTIKTSFLQQFPFATSHHELLAAVMPLAFESFSFDEYDLVISVTSESAKGIITKPLTKHICICLTPNRYLWSSYDDYFTGTFFRFISKPIVSYLRTWDVIASARPDAYIAISKEVQKRIKKYYNRESSVIYPPANLGQTKTYKPDGRSFSLGNKENGYFLVVSRLVPYKKVDIAINACNKLQIQLKIIGAGSEEKRLKRDAGQTIEFVGNLTEEAIIQYYKGCQGLIFPGLEDFGLAIIEAQKFGKPVIAFKGGGALETVIEGETGAFFYPQTADALALILEDFLKKNSKLSQKDLQQRENACMRQAALFTQEKFRKELTRFIEHYL